jgi:hypothetical protein
VTDTRRPDAFQPWTRAALLGLLGVLLLAPAPAEGQLRTRTGVGWVGAVPEALLGFGAFHFFGQSNWGLYSDVKLTHDARSRDPDFNSSLTVARVEAEFDPELMVPIHDWEDYVLLNLGLMRAISPDFALVVAGGAGRHRNIREYAEFFWVEGESEPQISGLVFVEDEANTAWKGNLAVNGLMRVGEQVLLSTGFELVPRSISLGLFVVFR